MEIRFVREFVSLAETESFFETAEKLFVTTSSLSRHIKALESEIGMPLFDRTTRKVTLNRFGQLFLPYARDLVRIDNECTAAFAAVNEDQRSTVSVGSIPMMKAYHITDLLAEYQSGSKTTVLNILEEDSFRLIPMLRNEELDFAFIRDHDDADDEFIKVPFADDRLCVVMPETHPLAGQDSVRLEQLKDEPLLLIGKDAFMYKLCTNLCLQAGFQPRVRFSSHRAENLIDMVSRNLGVAMLMRKPAERLIPEPVRLIDVSPTVKSIIYLAYNARHKLSAPAAKFWDLAKKLDDC